MHIEDNQDDEEDDDNEYGDDNYNDEGGGIEIVVCKSYTVNIK